ASASGNASTVALVASSALLASVSSSSAFFDLNKRPITPAFFLRPVSFLGAAGGTGGSCEVQDSSSSLTRSNESARELSSATSSTKVRTCASSRRALFWPRPRQRHLHRRPAEIRRPQLILR